MMHPDEIRRIIAGGLTCEDLQVGGDGQHFTALIVSAEFTGLSRVRRQQKVNEILRGHFDSGELHALSMKTCTPDEWRKLAGG